MTQKRGDIVTLRHGVTAYRTSDGYDPSIAITPAPPAHRGEGFYLCGEDLRKLLGLIGPEWMAELLGEAEAEQAEVERALEALTDDRLQRAEGLLGQALGRIEKLETSGMAKANALRLTVVSHRLQELEGSETAKANTLRLTVERVGKLETSGMAKANALRLMRKRIEKLEAAE